MKVKFRELPLKERIKKIAGISLMAVGVIIILSVIIVPLINKNRNKKQVQAVKENIMPSSSPESDSAAESDSPPESEEVSSEAATIDPQEEARQRREALLNESGCIGIIVIEKLGVELAIEEGDDDEVLKRAVGHMNASSNLGAKGNCVLSAHHGGYYGEFFLNIDKLENGDIIQLIDKSGNIYNYSVYEQKVVKRTDWSVVKELNEQATLTLITCVDRSQEERIIVSAVAF